MIKKLSKKIKNSEQVTSTPNLIIEPITSAPILIKEPSRSKSVPNLQKLTKEAFAPSFFSTPRHQAAPKPTGTNKLTALKRIISTNVIVGHNSTGKQAGSPGTDKAIKAFNNALKHAGDYLQFLCHDDWSVLAKAAEHGDFSESVTYLKKFNSYMDGKITGKELFPYFTQLNIDDNDFKKRVLNHNKENSLTSDKAKEDYTQVSKDITGLLIDNLHIKPASIDYALQQTNQRLHH